jgi:hypothetical protein
MAHNLNLAVAIVFQNHGLIIFADGKIVHPNVNPAQLSREAAAEIAANVAVVLAAQDIQDARVRAQIETVATKAIEAKTAAAQAHA